MAAATLIRRQLASAADEPQGNHPASSADPSPVLSVVTWVLLVVDIFAVSVQFLSSRTSFYMTRKFNLISAATLALCIGQSIAVSFQAHYGFGKHLSEISPGDLQLVFKSLYASELLYILAIASAKLSFTSFLYDLTPRKSHAVWLWIITGVIAAWTLSSFLVAAFQCHVPETWDLAHRRCIDLPAFFTYYSVLDIVTNAALTIFSIWLIISLRINSSWRKVKVSLNFALRILAIAATAVQLAFLQRDVENRADITHSLWRTQLLTQVVLTVSVVVSAVPMLRPFMSSLESGMIRVDDLRRTHRQDSYTNTARFSMRRTSRRALGGTSSDGAPSRKTSVPAVPVLQPMRGAREDEVEHV